MHRAVPTPVPVLHHDQPVFSAVTQVTGWAGAV